MNKLKEKGGRAIYVLGFPKSGNTWLARLLSEVTQSNILAEDPVNTADNSSDRKGDFTIHKEHVARDEQVLLKEQVVYIIRDIRDVLVSGFYHNHRWLNDEKINNNIIARLYFYAQIKRLNNKWQGSYWNEIKHNAGLLIKRMVGYNFEKIRIGNWSNHVNYWSSKDFVVVRYEDLLKDTKHELKRILSELEINANDTIIEDAVKKQSFAKKKQDFIDAGDELNTKFLRSGKIGAWRNLLPPNVVEIIEKEHGAVMNKYGYKLEHDQGEK